jgi:hypothetical protein
LYQYILNTKIIRLVQLLKNELHFVYDLRNNYLGNKPSYDISLLDGPIASEASVLADKAVFAQIKQQHRKLLGIEIESYAVFCAVEASCKPSPIPFSIKTVVDYGDREKDDNLQDFGAYASVYVAKAIIERL